MANRETLVDAPAPIRSAQQKLNEAITQPSTGPDGADKWPKRILDGAKKALTTIIENSGFESIPQEALRKEAEITAQWAKRYLAGKFLILDSAYEGASTHDVSRAVNKLFGGILGMLATARFGPQAGRAVGILAPEALNGISDITRKWRVGEQAFDISNENALNADAEFRTKLQTMFPTLSGEGALSPVHKVYDSSGALAGYFSVYIDGESNTHTATMFTPNGTIARQVTFNPNSGAITLNGSGITMATNPETGHVSATFDWDPGNSYEVNKNGSVQYYGCAFKLGAQPFDGTTVTCGADKYAVKPDAKVAKQGNYIVVSNESGDGAPSLLLTKVGGYTLDVNKDTREVVIRSFGNPNPTNVGNVNAWLDAFGYKNWKQSVDYSRDGALDSQDQSGDTQHMQPAQSSVGSNAASGTTKDLSFKSDGSGKMTTTNPDGTKTSADFNSLAGAAKLADIFGTLPDVVAAYPDRFALRYMSMVNQQAGQPQNQVPLAGDQAIGSGAPDADAKPYSSSETLSPVAGDAAAMDGHDAPNTTEGSPDPVSTQAQENQDAGGQEQDAPQPDEAMA